MLLLIALFFSFLITTPHDQVAATVFLTGSKTLEITDYSIVRDGIGTGLCVQSDPFTVGGYQWAIEFYPRGFNPAYSDFVSIMVRLINPRNDVKAIYTHRLQDWSTSTWSTNTPATSVVNTFSPSGYTAWGYFDFIRRSNFENSNYLRRDTLVIKTTVWVLRDSSAVLLPTLLTVREVSTEGGNNHWNLTSAGVSFDTSTNQTDA